MTSTLSRTSLAFASAAGQPSSNTMEEVLFELRRLIVGQDHLLECLLVALLARGHVLLEGVPAEVTAFATGRGTAFLTVAGPLALGWFGRFP